MLVNATYLEGLAVRATDGELGTVDEFYFDDETWAIRYLIVRTGGWLSDRNVLISPISVVHTDWQSRRLDVSLTKQQVEDSPLIDTQRPVSRQHEVEYLGYYGYPNYWGGPYLWGATINPAARPIPKTSAAEAIVEKVRKASTDSHLRSTKPFLAITLRQRMAKSATWTGLSSTMRPGLSATLRSQRGIGGLVRGCWFHPRGLNGSAGRTLRSTSALTGRPSGTARIISSPN